jgi:hypothetical protein
LLGALDSCICPGPGRLNLEAFAAANKRTPPPRSTWTPSANRHHCCLFGFIIHTCDVMCLGKYKNFVFYANAERQPQEPGSFSVLFFTGRVARSKLFFYLDTNRFPRRLTSDLTVTHALLSSGQHAHWLALTGAVSSRHALTWTEEGVLPPAAKERAPAPSPTGRSTS